MSGAADQDQPSARGGLPGPHLPAQPGVPGGEAVEGEPGQGQPEGVCESLERRRQPGVLVSPRGWTHLLLFLLISI